MKSKLVKIFMLVMAIAGAVAVVTAVIRGNKQGDVLAEVKSIFTV